MQQNPILNEYLSNFSLKMLCNTNSQVLKRSKIENSVIFSPSCRSNPLQHSFFGGTKESLGQNKIAPN